ncbi:MAG: patatin-like protein [Steroidobacteraceae bacterium]
MEPTQAVPAEGPIKEKELRIALVCYGGVSLAIYQHGITKEILKLVRASRAYHAAIAPWQKQRPDHLFKPGQVDGQSPSTEDVYFDALKAIGGRGLDLRVIVDVIAGASSGGINGIVLARALAHDLRIDSVTNVWLRDVDIASLLAPEAKAEPWHKWYVRPFLRPFLWELKRMKLLKQSVDRETRDKLSMFLRSRWFEPPLDGSSLSAVLLDAMEAMGDPPQPGATLVPAGQRLDLAVTVTDYYGAERLIHLHDPPIVREREHRQVLRFAYEHRQTGTELTDFDADNVPSLAFAARATSSYPAAFPPVQVREMDALLAGRGRSWPRREAFLDQNFGHYRDLGLDPEDAVLVDGSVLANKPFHIAIEALKTHAAFREVDRRLVYIDPNPKSHASPVPGQVPGFFSTIRSALSDLPRSDPINDELAWIGRLNEQARRERAAIDAVRPDVVARVEAIAGKALDEPVTARQLTRWRIDAGRVLMADARITYNQYVRLMIGEALEYLAHLVCSVCGYSHNSPRALWVAEVLDTWARRKHIYQMNYEIPAAATSEAGLAPSMTFMVNLNLAYRYRRHHFVIQATNRFYPRLSEPGLGGLTSGALDDFKAQVYGCLEALNPFESSRFLSGDGREQIRAVFAHGIPAAVQPERLPEADAFVERQGTAIEALVDQVSRECHFVRFNEDADAVLASPAFLALGASCRRELLIAYIGFVFWDIILLPMIRSREEHKLGELGEIIVDRISPEDALSLRASNSPPMLKGAEFGGFGAFFSRKAREHDYLWGRLDAVDRLFDLLASSAARDTQGGIDMRPYKKRAFAAVLAEEAERLSGIPGLVAQLKKRVESL